MRAIGAALLIGLVAVACDDSGVSVGEPPPVEAPPPFVAGPPPDGPDFELIAAGEGGLHIPWGDDDNGTDEPFTVLAPPGADATDPRIVVVSATGFADYQGGFEQASASTEDTPRTLTVDGRDAIYAPARRGDGPQAEWADIVVKHGSDLALRAQSRRASREELVEVLERARPGTDRNEAPTVADPPRGLRVLGSVDARVANVLRGDVYVPDGTGPGPAGARGIGWSSGTGLGSSDASVVLLPGDSANLAAIPGYVAFEDWRPDVRPITIGGRPGWLVIGTYDDDDVLGGYLAVATHTEAGDLALTVVWSHLVSEEEVVALAESVRPATAAEWDALVASVVDQ
jgi:hypothetical protein